MEGTDQTTTNPSGASTLQLETLKAPQLVGHPDTKKVIEYREKRKAYLRAFREFQVQHGTDLKPRGHRTQFSKETLQYLLAGEFFGYTEEQLTEERLEKWVADKDWPVIEKTELETRLSKIKFDLKQTDPTSVVTKYVGDFRRTIEEAGWLDIYEDEPKEVVKWLVSGLQPTRFKEVIKNAVARNQGLKKDVKAFVKILYEDLETYNRMQPIVKRNPTKPSSQDNREDSTNSAGVIGKGGNSGGSAGKKTCYFCWLKTGKKIPHVMYNCNRLKAECKDDDEAKMKKKIEDRLRELRSKMRTDDEFKKNRLSSFSRVFFDKTRTGDSLSSWEHDLENKSNVTIHLERYLDDQGQVRWRPREDGDYKSLSQYQRELHRRLMYSGFVKDGVEPAFVSSMDSIDGVFSEDVHAEKLKHFTKKGEEVAAYGGRGTMRTIQRLNASRPEQRIHEIVRFNNLVQWRTKIDDGASDSCVPAALIERMFSHAKQKDVSTDSFKIRELRQPRIYRMAATGHTIACTHEIVFQEVRIWTPDKIAVVHNVHAMIANCRMDEVLLGRPFLRALGIDVPQMLNAKFNKTHQNTTSRGLQTKGPIPDEEDGNVVHFHIKHEEEEFYDLKELQEFNADDFRPRVHAQSTVDESYGAYSLHILQTAIDSGTDLFTAITKSEYRAYDHDIFKALVDEAVNLQGQGFSPTRDISMVDCGSSFAKLTRAIEDEDIYYDYVRQSTAAVLGKTEQEHRRLLRFTDEVIPKPIHSGWVKQCYALIEGGEDTKEEITTSMNSMIQEAIEHGKLNDEAGQRLGHLVHEFRDVFRTKLGKDPPIKTEPYEFVLKEGAEPYRAPARRYNKVEMSLGSSTRTTRVFGRVRYTMFRNLPQNLVRYRTFRLIQASMNIRRQMNGNI